ncbi:similar to Uncharacterized protein conserved in bacteria with a cystatin-like fold [Ectocarpus siliculosus]|uniref:Similar to Uncharacterized protein conserved in bacteria with a cystatin-like fold n=1 Tax=Ectocarpus siliculosus TaxID=2880 RepID=D7FY20_ECTSI|nr:similar to Uncharacterized protein conserved in bacteria with a cystatin-like fold [Ectocarpus siliculosus]|eukprot:CBJ32433.1 similar to Uncharacterized protein conserved in bacteria with a cystatin-like fold [Ectocarpus siliculosus]
MAHYRENREVLQRKGEQSLAFEMMRSKAEPDQFADWLQGPLHLACDSGNSDLVDKLLEAGAGIAAGGIGEDGRTLLHAAAASGNERVVSALLRTPARADINIKSASHAHWRYRGTPLQVAVRGGHESVARTLIAAGADLALALTMAVRRGQERIAYDLLLAGADPNEVDNENGGGDGATPLALAAEQGFEQLVRALLHKGATEPPPRATRVRTAGAVLQSAKSRGPAAAVNPNGKSSISRSRPTRQAAAAAAADEEKKEELMMPEKNMILMQQRQQERRRLQTQSHKLRKEKKAAAAATALPPLPPTVSKTASPRRATLPLSASSPSPVASRSVVRPPALRTPTPPRISAEERDKKAVSAAAIAWTNAVTSGARDAPRRTAALYAEDGSLWETVSEEVCNTPQQITAYFERFARLPQLRMVEYTPVAARVYGEFAVLAGTYTFAWRGEDGGPVEKRARFSFTFRRDRTRGAPRPWLIVEHHSSSMPTAPEAAAAAAASATAAGPPEPVDPTPPRTKAAKIGNDPNADQRAVAAATVMWTRAVALGTDEAPRKTAALYAKDATLWGSVSDAIRDTPDLIYKYFDKFSRLPELRLVDFAPVTVRVYGDFAVQAGTYTFSWRGEGGASVERQARFTFTFRRDGNPGNPYGWSIVEHHAVPVGLSRVSSGVDLADLSKSLADVRSATATAPPSTTTYSAASVCDEDAIEFDETGSMAGESDGDTDADLGDMPSPATAARAAPKAPKTTRRRGLLVSSASILATILTDPPSSSSILATVMTIPPATCAAICVGGLAGALLGLSTVAFLMGSGTSSSDLEAAPPVASAAVNALRFLGRMASV